MTETHTPETETPPPRPTPTHTVEVYLADDRLMGGQGRIERYFYAAETAAEAAYKQVGGALQDRLDRDNDAPSLIEVDDLYGRGSIITRHLCGVRIIATLDLEDWGIGMQAKLAGAREAAKHTAAVGAYAAYAELDEVEETPA